MVSIHTSVSALDGRYLRPLATKALSVTIDKMMRPASAKRPHSLSCLTLIPFRGIGLCPYYPHLLSTPYPL